MSNKLSTIAKNIKKLRKEKGISQDRLSKLANISYNTIIKIENGAIQNPGIDTVQKIAQVFKIKVDDLIK
ncbi:helix-turn-helix domain-containing protein [bacterium]|nr:helix-turn-helix domain-containing protein [bacterium]